MSKLVNPAVAAWAGLGMLFFSVFASFQTTLLNPQMEISNATFFPLFFKTALLFGIPLGAALYFAMTLFPARAFRILFWFSMLVVAALPVERALHPLFLHPALITILYKGAYAGAVVLGGSFLLKKYPWLVFLLICAGAIFLYHRRDAFQPPRGAVYGGSTGVRIPSRVAVISFSGAEPDALWDALKAGRLPRLEEAGSRGCTGTFKVPDYMDERALYAALLTGTYPYQNRIFGTRANSVGFIGADIRLPFFIPAWKEASGRSPAVPLIWNVLSSRGVSCGVVDPPVFRPEGEALTFCILDGRVDRAGLRPGQEYASAVSFLFKQVHLRDPWEDRLENELAQLREHSGPGDYLVALAGPAGFMRLEGPGIRAGQKATSMKMTDLVPTLAYLLQVPLSSEMPGRILLEAFDEEHLRTHPVGFVGRY